MLIKDVLHKTTQFFRDKGFESPRLDTELLLASALHWERMKLYLNYEYPLSEAELTSCRDLVKRRASGEPVAYILGRKDFYGHSFKVSSSVLIPRPDTETLVENVITWVSANQPSARIVDIGTGSGCIGLSLLAACPEARLLAVDISASALEVARENASDLGVESRTRFIEANGGALELDAVAEALGEACDVVVANPPYIAHDDPDVQTNVKKFEPATALFSDENGLKHVREWAETAARIARDGALVMFEIGYSQGETAKNIFLNNGHYRDIEIVRDLAGHERFVRAFVKDSEGN